jgi:hypothetical protein
MIGQCRNVLGQNAQQWNIPEHGDWRALLINNYQPNYSTLSLFWFCNGAEFPSVVTKIFGAPDIPRQEFENLKDVYVAAPTLVPRPLHFGPNGEFWMLWMEGMPGWPFQPRKDSSSVRLGSVMDALVSIHCRVRREHAEGDRHRRMVVEPLNTIAQFGQEESVRAGCERLATRCTEQWLGSLAIIPQHGDFFVSNLLLYRNKWSFLDWESYGAIDLPFYDVFTFLISLLLEGGEGPEYWSSSLVEKVKGLIRRYARGLGGDFPDLSLLLPLTLANWFHLQWLDGRSAFTARMYRTIGHYFEHVDQWEEVFLER